MGFGSAGRSTNYLRAPAAMERWAFDDTARFEVSVKPISYQKVVASSQSKPAKLSADPIVLCLELPVAV